MNSTWMASMATPFPDLLFISGAYRKSERSAVTGPTVYLSWLHRRDYELSQTMPYGCLACLLICNQTIKSARPSMQVRHKRERPRK